MTQTHNYNQVRNHSFLHLNLQRVSMGSYPYHVKQTTSTANRLALINADSGRDDSMIRDSKSGEVFPMRKGFIYFIPSMHTVDIDLADELEFVSFHFNLDFFYGVDVFTNFGKCIMVENQELLTEGKLLINDVGDIKDLCRINKIIYNLCLSFLSDSSTAIQPHIANWRDYEKILNYVKEFVSARTTVAMLAEMNNMRQDVFSRKFTHDMGISPKKFLLNTLLRKSMEMLSIPGTPIYSVAEKLNFSSDFNFSRFFKKQTGISPNHFRKRAQGGMEH